MITDSHIVVLLGPEIRRLRKKQQLTQTELAKLLDISRVTVTNWEIGERIPSFVFVAKLSHILGLKLDPLIEQAFNE